MPQLRVRSIVSALALGLVTVACASTTTPDPTVADETPGTPPPASTTEITSIESSTDPRLEEIRALTTDLMMRRLQALYHADKDALADVIADPEFLDHDFELVEDGHFEFAMEPTVDTVPYKILEVHVDDGSCLVVRSRIDLTDALEFFAPSQEIDVFWLEGDTARIAQIFGIGANEDDWGPVCDAAP